MARKPWSREDLELDKFDVNPDGDTIVRVNDDELIDAVTNTGSAAGSTDHFNSTVGTTPVNVPSIDGQNIVDVLVEVPEGQTATNILYVSFDGGTNFKTMSTSASMNWSPRGGLKHLVIKGNTAGVEYEIILNREP
jgi:hypothetical protein